MYFDAVSVKMAFDTDISGKSFVTNDTYVEFRTFAQNMAFESLINAAFVTFQTMN